MPAALSFLAAARNSVHVFGPLFGSRPAFLNSVLFQTKGMPSSYCGIAHSLPPDRLALFGSSAAVPVGLDDALDANTAEPTTTTAPSTATTCFFTIIPPLLAPGPLNADSTPEAAPPEGPARRPRSASGR